MIYYDSKWFPIIPYDFQWLHKISYDFLWFLSSYNPTGQLAVVVADAATRPPIRRYVALTGQRCDDMEDEEEEEENQEEEE